MSVTPNPFGLWRENASLVLASKSAARAALLAGTGIPFEVLPAQINEREIEARLASTPVGIAMALASAKAAAVFASMPGRLVLGADQVLVHDNRLLHKPETFDAARRQLFELGGTTHELHSAISVWKDSGQIFSSVCTARLTMRALSSDFIKRYVEAGGQEVLASVGAYQLEGLGVHLFESIEGDYSTILGLPIFPLLNFLRRNGNLAD